MNDRIEQLEIGKMQDHEEQLRLLQLLQTTIKSKNGPESYI